jgi:hypothetical protein
MKTYSKIPKKQKKGWGIPEVVEHLPNKCRVLNSNPNTTRIMM